MIKYNLLSWNLDWSQQTKKGRVVNWFGQTFNFVRFLLHLEVPPKKTRHKERKLNGILKQVCFNCQLGTSRWRKRESAARVFTFPQQQSLCLLLCRLAALTFTFQMYVSRRWSGALRWHLVAVGERGKHLGCDEALHRHLHRQHPPLDRLQRHNCEEEKRKWATNESTQVSANCSRLTVFTILGIFFTG